MAMGSVNMIFTLRSTFSKHYRITYLLQRTKLDCFIDHELKFQRMQIPYNIIQVSMITYQHDLECCRWTLFPLRRSDKMVRTLLLFGESDDLDTVTDSACVYTTQKPPSQQREITLISSDVKERIVTSNSGIWIVSWVENECNCSMKIV